MAGNIVNLTFNMSDGEEHSASFLLPGEEQKLQSDIYDRTEGVGAIPGAFGFGYIFNLDKRVQLKGAGAFNDWVSSVLPGRYYVFGAYGVEAAPGIQINGIIEVIYPIGMFNGDPTKTEKILIYYGMGERSVYIGAYTVFLNGQWRGWVPVFFDDTELKTLISAKASLESPSFSGTPTTPTPSDDAVGLEIANAAFVRKLISALVDSSPEALNTLNELAAALGDDPNFATTMLNALAKKQPLHEILTSLSGLASAANKLPYFSGKDVMSMTDLSDVGREIIGKPSKAEVLSYLGVEKTAILYGSDTSSWRSPLTGGLTLAAYLPENDGGSVSLLRGQGVQGSRLRQVVFEAEYRSSGFSATPRSFVYGNTLSGTYVALSGGPDVTFTKGIVSLFVRIA